MATTSVGKPFCRIDGSLKVTGQTKYTSDFSLPNMIWGKTLRSPKAHASILKIDVTQAKKVPGVLEVITAFDLPNVLVGRRLYDMPILARERVRFIGERIAVVAAKELEAAEDAQSRINVEFGELTPVFDPLEAMQKGAPIIHPDFTKYRGHTALSNTDCQNLQSMATWELGNIVQGFEQSDHIFEHTFKTHYVHQGYLEPHAAIVQVTPANEVQVWASNKVPYDVKQYLCDATGLKEEQVVVNILAIGGDFGGKGSLMDIPLCYYLALRTGRPVKMVMTYTEELMAGNPRHPALITIRTGVTKKGVILARQARILWNGGAYGAMKPNSKVNLQGASYALGPYHIPHVKIESTIVYTNAVPCGHFRGPGHVQTTFAGESQMDIIAESLGLDPFEFRMINALQDGDLTPDLRPITEVRFRETLTTLARASGWKKNKQRPRSGIGIAVSYSRTGAGDANVRLSVGSDGRILFVTTFTEQGTGCYTVMCQIVAEILGTQVDDIELRIGSTQTFQYEAGTGASRVTYVLGNATLSAALELRKLLQKLTAQVLGCAEDEVRIGSQRCYSHRSRTKSISFAELATRAAEEGSAIEVQKYFKAAEPPSQGSIAAVAAKVRVDIQTGQIIVEKITTANDVGAVLNPLTHQGQIDGGIIQGIGFSLTEEMQIDDGQITTVNLGEYKLPNIQDIPRLRTILVKESSGPSPYAGKEIGESAISPVSAAIANAVFNAVGVRVLDLPITAEKVHATLARHKKHS